MNESNIYLLASHFRETFEQIELSQEVIGEEAFLRMKEFPDGTCSEVCTVVGVYFTEELGLAPLAERVAQIEEGERWFGTHQWLEYDGIIVDITADQFSMVEEPVIVSRQSTFHEHYANQKATITTTFGLEHTPTWMIPLYRAVKEKFERLT